MSAQTTAAFARPVDMTPLTRYVKGETRYIGKPFYKAYDAAPVKLQAHGDKSEPISFRNIWIRDIK